jgi:hypothetical protein
MKMHFPTALSGQGTDGVKEAKTSEIVERLVWVLRG